MSEYGNTDLIRSLFRTLLGEAAISCSNNDESLLELVKQALVIGDDGYPALTIGTGDSGGFPSVVCTETLAAYVAYVEGQSGTIVDELLLKEFLCPLLR